MEKKKKVIVLSIVGVIVLIASIVGVTYAWFNTSINGDGAQFNVTTATVGPLSYTGTEITADDVMPGWVSDDATLTVEGTVTGSEAVNYYCSIENTGSVTDVEYRISSDGEENSTNATWMSIGTSPIVRGSISSTNASDEYKLAIRFKETGLNQNDQQGKELSVKVTCNLDVTYQVNVTSTDNTLGTVTMASNEILHGGNAVVTLTPIEGYRYASDTCNGVYKEKTLTINNVTTPTECEVTFEKVCEDGTLCNQILTDNSNVEVRSDFSVIYTASNNGNTIHIANGQDNTPTYYFAGNVTNNYVKFGTNSEGADMYWRIVRINEDGSVRLLYVGTDINTTEGFITLTSGNKIISYNTNHNNASYVGYKYTVGEQHGNNINSTIKEAVDEWYDNNLMDEANYISKTAIYCNDREIASGYTWQATGGIRYTYKGEERLFGNDKTSAFSGNTILPTYACTNIADQFTASINIGNNELTDTNGISRPIALITADEVVYAGGLFNTQNTSYYISKNATSGANWWWTMTPHGWYMLSQHSGMFRIISSGGLSYDDVIGDGNAIRPVTSLKSCVTWSKGDGTASSPYEVTVDEACTTLEN